jgi:hypothetical protein
MNEDYIWVLIARKLAGEITPEEQTQLTSLLDEDPVMQKRFTIINTFWNRPELPAEEENPSFNNQR